MRHAIASGFKAVRRRPGFAITAILVLGLAAAANATILAVVHGILLQPLPYRDPDRLVAVWPGRFQSNADLQWLRDHGAPFSAIGGVAPGWTMALTGSGEPLKVTIARVSGSLFDVLGVQPLLGRTLRDDDARRGSDLVIVLTHALWQARFAGDPAVIGRTVQLDGRPFEVVGVLRPDFEIFNLRTDAFTPFALDPSAWYHQLAFLLVTARLEPGVSLEEADRRYKALVPRIRRERGHPDSYGRTAHLRDMKTAVVGDVRAAAVVAASAVAVLVLIAAANVGTLLLTRAAGRAREIAIRAAMGASRGRIGAELMAEGLAIALAAGVAGTLAARLALPAVLSLLPRDTPRTAEIAVDWRVSLAAIGATALAGLLFAFAPAVASVRVRTAALLRAGAHSESRRSKRLRGSIATTEIALALVLSTGAGLMVRSLWRLQGIDPGFDGDRVLALHLQPANIGGRSERTTAGYYAAVLEKLRALPGVESAGAIQHLPFSGYSWTGALDIEGHSVPPGGQRPTAGLRIVTPSYFASIGQPLVAGRDLDEGDASGQRSVIVNETLAKTYFGGPSNALGRTLRIRGGGVQGSWLTIGGVVGDVRHTSLTDPVPAEIYTSITATSISAMMLAVRATGDPLALVPSVREAIRAVDRSVPISDVQTMTAKVGASLARPRLLVGVLGGFAAASLLLVLVGVYGVIAYSAAQRRREVAIMMALGAGRARVVRMVLTEGLTYAAVGVAAGTLAALAASRLLRTVVYGVTPTDPATYATLAALTTAVVLAACLVPALRTSRLDPARALNQE